MSAQHFTLEQICEGLNKTKPFRVRSVNIEHPYYISVSFGTDSANFNQGIALGEGENEKGEFAWTWNEDNLGVDSCGDVRNYPTLFGVVGDFWRAVDNALEEKELSTSCGACGELYFLSHDCDQEPRETRVSTYFEAEVISQTLSIRANSSEEAEEKYGNYFNSENCEDCEKLGRECDCVNETEDCYHNMDEGTQVSESLCSCGEWVAFGSVAAHSLNWEHIRTILTQ
jgi:hypothetical protein